MLRSTNRLAAGQLVSRTFSELGLGNWRLAAFRDGPDQLFSIITDGIQFPSAVPASELSICTPFFVVLVLCGFLGGNAHVTSLSGSCRSSAADGCSCFYFRFGTSGPPNIIGG